MKISPIYILNPDLTQIQLKDAIAERIDKLEALTTISQTEDFMEFTENNLANYFWLQHGLLKELSELFRAYSRLNH